MCVSLFAMITIKIFHKKKPKIFLSKIEQKAKQKRIWYKGGIYTMDFPVWTLYYTLNSIYFGIKNFQIYKWMNISLRTINRELVTPFIIVYLCVSSFLLSIGTFLLLLLPAPFIYFSFLNSKASFCHFPHSFEYILVLLLSFYLNCQKHHFQIWRW